MNDDIPTEPGMEGRVRTATVEWARGTDGRWYPLGRAGGYQWDALVRLFPDLVILP